MSDKEINAPYGQAAGRDITNDTTIRQVAHGHIFNGCPGQSVCLLAQSEEARQVAFEKATGINCSKGAREAFQFLLDSGVFHHRQLSLAWRQGTIVWDWDAVELKAKPSLMDIIFGWFILLSSAGTLLLGVLSLLVVRGAESPSVEHLQLIGVCLLFVFGIFFAEKYLLRTNHVARRARPVLAEYYASTEIGSEEAGAVWRGRLRYVSPR